MTTELYDDLRFISRNLAQINVSPELLKALEVEYYAKGELIPSDLTSSGVYGTLVGVPVIVDETLTTKDYKFIYKDAPCCDNPDHIIQKAEVVKPLCSYYKYRIKCARCGKVIDEYCEV
jgi:hypothetical protein